MAEAQSVERPPETRGVAGSIPAGHIRLDSVAQAELPVLTRADVGSTPTGVTKWKDCHWRGIPSRKRVGFAALGVRLPLLPLVRRHGRVRQGSALLARRRQQPLAGSNPAASASSPRSSAEKSSGFRPHARPFESGRGVHVHDATSFNGRTTGCYPGDAGSTPAVAASCPDRLDGRGRRSLTPETRVRVPLGVLHALGRVWDMRPGCLPGEAGSIPVESASRRSSNG